MQESIVFLLRVQCCRKESSRSLSHLLMSFLYFKGRVFLRLDLQLLGSMIGPPSFDTGLAPNRARVVY